MTENGLENRENYNNKMTNHTQLKKSESKKIKLTNGYFAIVDASDYYKYPEISTRKWRVVIGPTGKVYASRCFANGGNHGRPMLMHRFLMGNPVGFEIDHINGDSLDNRRRNLRMCTHAQNGMNRKIGKNNTSGYKGVVFDKKAKKNKWCVKLKLNGQSKCVGKCFTKEEAARLYNEFAIKNWGEFAKLNVIPLNTKK